MRRDETRKHSLENGSNHRDQWRYHIAKRPVEVDGEHQEKDTARQVRMMQCRNKRCVRRCKQSTTMDTRASAQFVEGTEVKGMMLMKDADDDLEERCATHQDAAATDGM